MRGQCQDPCPRAFPLLGCAGCNACLAAGRRHNLLSLCPLVCSRGCHTRYLLDSHCTSSCDQGKPYLCQIFLLLSPDWSDAAFTGEPFAFSSWQGDGEFLQLLASVASACWGYRGLLSKSLEISSKAQLLLVEATCLSDICSAAFLWGSALINWRRPPCQMQGSVKHP